MKTKRHLSGCTDTIHLLNRKKLHGSTSHLLLCDHTATSIGLRNGSKDRNWISLSVQSGGMCNFS